MSLKSNVIKFSAVALGTVAAGTVFAATNANADEIYTVQSGDTLSGISYKYANDTSMVDTLAQNNNIADKNLIIVGQKLMITSDGEIRKATEQEVETTPSADSDASSDSSAASSSSTASADTTTGSEAAAKATIASRESGGSYTAQNGQYYGKYQLSLSYLGGDLSAANQERVADSYVASRYGSWVNALSFWNANGWY